MLYIIDTANIEKIKQRVLTFALHMKICYNCLIKGGIAMKFLLNTQEERCRMEVYNEYLRKIPQLLEQLEAVEKMYEKAVMEEKMLETKADDNSRALYADRLARTKKQCKDRADDIREQERLIFALKAQIENESSALRELID